MKRLGTLLIGGFCMFMTAGCAEKKAQAAKLEQEMLKQEQAATEFVADTSTADSNLPNVGRAEEMNPLAIPEEELQAVTFKYEEKKGYAVQIAACESLDYAQYLVEIYTQRGYDPYMVVSTVGAQTYYCVCIGGIATFKEAQDLKNELLDKYSVQACIEEIK